MIRAPNPASEFAHLAVRETTDIAALKVFTRGAKSASERDQARMLREIVSEIDKEIDASLPKASQDLNALFIDIQKETP